MMTGDHMKYKLLMCISRCCKISCFQKNLFILELYFFQTYFKIILVNLFIAGSIKIISLCSK